MAVADMILAHALGIAAVLEAVVIDGEFATSKTTQTGTQSFKSSRQIFAFRILSLSEIPTFMFNVILLNLCTGPKIMSPPPKIVSEIESCVRFWISWWVL